MYHNILLVFTVLICAIYNFMFSTNILSMHITFDTNHFCLRIKFVCFFFTFISFRFNVCESVAWIVLIYIYKCIFHSHLALGIFYSKHICAPIYSFPSQPIPCYVLRNVKNLYCIDSHKNNSKANYSVMNTNVWSFSF